MARTFFIGPFEQEGNASETATEPLYLLSIPDALLLPYSQLLGVGTKVCVPYKVPHTFIHS